jgi:hypothetical protein
VTGAVSVDGLLVCPGLPVGDGVAAPVVWVGAGVVGEAFTGWLGLLDGVVITVVSQTLEAAYRLTTMRRASARSSAPIPAATRFWLVVSRVSTGRFSATSTIADICSGPMSPDNPRKIATLPSAAAT